MNNSNKKANNSNWIPFNYSRDSTPTCDLYVVRGTGEINVKE